MLAEIYIENIALITNLRLVLGEGFNVFTGETGAGKSILLDAMALMLGAKADSQLIRHGTEKALVEGVFINLNTDVKHLMQVYGVEGDELILTREITFGRSSSRVNGRTYPLNVLREFGEKLVNIYGQHDFQTLLKPDNHLRLLDALSSEIINTKPQLHEISRRISKISNQLKDINNKAQEAAKELDFLNFQAKEIDEAELSETEEEELLSRQKFLANAEKIIYSLSNTYNLLYGGQKNNVSEQLGEAVKNLTAVADFSTELKDFTDQLYDITANCDDLAMNIKSYLENIEYNPHDLEETDERLYTIKTLKKKYGATIKEILEYRIKIQERLDSITYSSDNEAKLNLELKNLQKGYDTLADKLTELRKNTANMLETKVVKILKEMNMSANLKVEFTLTKDYSSEGRENAEFYIQTNAGEAFKPLAKIASGGELARFMLAMRTVINTADPVPTLVFDEVDAGMGGITLSRVAEKINELSQDLQILCVTHSAQLAAKGKIHFLVEKTELNNKTFTNVVKLQEEKRVEEIARMLDGQITNTGIIHASELLKV